MPYYVYLLATKRDGVLYTGMTSDLVCRSFAHREKAVPGFTARYGIDRLVWYEIHDTLDGAFLREKQIKRWRRAWKIALIEKTNPNWLDLFEQISA